MSRIWRPLCLGQTLPNRKKRTPKAINILLSTLAEGLSIGAACRAAGIGRTTYWEWQQEDVAFAAQCEDAIEQGTDRLEDIARIRAEEQSDTLLIFLLKARRPAKYRETIRNEHTGPDGKDLTIVFSQREDGPQ